MTPPTRLVDRTVRFTLTAAENYVIARPEAVAISSTAVVTCKMLLNIENLKCTMLIGALLIDTWVPEIATSRCSSQ